MEQPTETVSGLDALKALPIEKRLIYLLQMLDRLKQGNMAKMHRQCFTKRQEVENSNRLGTIKAYNDTSKFVTAIFEAELRAALLPETHEESQETPIIQEG